eukprot:1160002-Pelagomonas_calceolata.AAC.19
MLPAGIQSRHSSSSGYGGFADKGGAKYLITLNAKAELQLQPHQAQPSAFPTNACVHIKPVQLLYKPETLGPQSWEVCFEPVSQDGDSKHVATPERRVVNAEGVRPRLNVSRASIDFGTRIVIRSNQIKVNSRAGLCLAVQLAIQGKPFKAGLAIDSPFNWPSKAGMYLLCVQSLFARLEEDCTKIVQDRVKKGLTSHKVIASTALDGHAVFN